MMSSRIYCDNPAFPPGRYYFEDDCGCYKGPAKRKCSYCGKQVYPLENPIRLKSGLVYHDYCYEAAGAEGIL
jgi:hypothetical protein